MTPAGEISVMLATIGALASTATQALPEASISIPKTPPLFAMGPPLYWMPTAKSVGAELRVGWKGAAAAARAKRAAALLPGLRAMSMAA